MIGAIQNVPYATACLASGLEMLVRMGLPETEVMQLPSCHPSLGIQPQGLDTPISALLHPYPSYEHAGDEAALQICSEILVLGDTAARGDCPSLSGFQG